MSNQLHAALHFFSDVVMLTKYTSGAAKTSYPVALSDVAAALGELSLGTGVLPPQTVFWERRAGQHRIGVYVPARRWEVAVRTTKKTVARWTVPLPPLLWIGRGSTYSLWALRKRPRPGDDPDLFLAPTPNVGLGTHGGICAGSVRFPPCRPDTTETALAMFFASEFNDHLAGNKCRSHPESVLALWRELHERGKKRFPGGELVAAGWPLSRLLRAPDD